MRSKILFSACIIICSVFCISGYCDNPGLSLTLSSTKSSYHEEDEIVLALTIENTSSEEKRVDLKYLQPVEKKYLYVAESPYRLAVEFNGKPADRFTNYMPQEPKPGTLSLTMKPGEKIAWGVWFPYWYYHYGLPGQFRIRLLYGDIVSNEVTFSVLKSSGAPVGGSINVNPDFTQGGELLYGWKLHDRKTVWDRENNQLVFHLDRTTAEGEGLWAYSLFYEIESPGEYQLKARFKSSAPEVIIFVEEWKLLGGRRRRPDREECPIHPEDDWSEYTFNMAFKPGIRWIRIKLYSYLSAGDIYFKNVSLTKK